MARALQSTKVERKDIQSSKSNRQDKEHSKSELKTMKSTMNGGEKALHGLAPKLNGLAPKRANSASVLRRKTNNPSLESLSSCRHEALAIDGVKAPRATQAVLEPGTIICTLKVSTAARTVQCKRGSGCVIPRARFLHHGFWQPLALCIRKKTSKSLSPP